MASSVEISNLKNLTTLEKRLIISILLCMVLLAVIYQWFLKVKEEAENPLPAHMRQNHLLLERQRANSNDEDDIKEKPEEDPIQIFEKTKKTQRGLGNMLREDVKLPEAKPVSSGKAAPPAAKSAGKVIEKPVATEDKRPDKSVSKPVSKP